MWVACQYTLRALFKDICFKRKDVILVDSCRFRKSFVLPERMPVIQCKNYKGQIEDAYLNLDFVEQWATEHSTIIRFIVRAETKVVASPADSLRVVHWEPTDEEAELNLVLKKATVH